jgi:DNA-directed RNA polymerase subunit M/transcription elongation factor TFIIS
MAILDSGTEWRRLSELYGRMADGELLALARKQSELTEVAQDALANEMRFRKLKLEAEAPTEPPKPARELDPAYDEERKLVLIRTVWSLAGIPFFMGSEMATGVDTVTSNFAAGVDVKIMSIGVSWAGRALQGYEPMNEPAEEQQPEPAELPVKCPRCHSTEVVFENLIGEEPKTEKDSPQEFEWACDSCGHRWTDDGIAREKP